MAGQASARPLMPQFAQNSNVSFFPPATVPRENQKNYVFVDEHNRHKRLKVMRACEGCRKRKIKCDAATSNTWPCAPCTRLKLHCVPPSICYDTDTSPTTSSADTRRRRSSDNNRDAGAVAHPSHSINRQHSSNELNDARTGAMLRANSTMQLGSIKAEPYRQRSTSDEDVRSASVRHASIAQPNLDYTVTSTFSSSAARYQVVYPESNEEWRPDVAAASLSEALGDLKIDHTAVAAYIVNQKKSLAEAPAQEEFEIQLPPHFSPDHTVRIPPEMMPSDQQATRYFDYFFSHIHPYVPVVNKACFDHQWRTNRDSISPILLEAVFACASEMVDGPAQANRWLALAARHEESFKDVPRLSTIQAMILILKAREAAPKRGYYYRSWMTILNCIAMAKELELHEHYQLHRAGKTCGSSMFDCVTKTKVWHTLFVLGVMVGGAQGRSDFGISIDTLDFNIAPFTPGPEPSDIQVSRQFTYFMRAVRTVQQSSLLYAKLKKTRDDWALDTEFTAHNADFEPWLQDLPPDLQVHYPADSSPPWIVSHIVANIHCYYHLTVIMHHRPQLQAASLARDGSWRRYLVTCYDSAKKMCRLQEAILRDYGLPGLLCMLRGINFTIYAVLTCTMLHLVALTSPDPELYSEAKDFFTRHMRILEQCTSSWPMPEMQAQIDALREAFSADITKPFELKLSFPLGSPGAFNKAAPVNDTRFCQPELSHNTSIEKRGQTHYKAAPISPPPTASDYGSFDSKADTPIDHSSVAMTSDPGQQQLPASDQLLLENTVHWDPTRIFDHWNTAFGTPAASTSSQSSPPTKPPTSPTSFATPQPQAIPQSAFPQLPTYQQQSYQYTTQLSQIQQVPAQQYGTSAAPYITPSMWQDAVASTYGDGLKRRWDYNDSAGNHMSKRPR